VKKVPAAKAKARTVKETAMAAMEMLPRNVNRIRRPKSKAEAEFCPVALATAQAKAARELVLIVMAKDVMKKVPAAKAKVPRDVRATVMAAMATLTRNRNRRKETATKEVNKLLTGLLFDEWHLKDSRIISIS